MIGTRSVSSPAGLLFRAVAAPVCNSAALVAGLLLLPALLVIPSHVARSLASGILYDLQHGCCTCRRCRRET